MANLTRIQANNAELQECIDKANNLPDAGGGSIDTSGLTATAGTVLLGETFIGANGEIEEGTIPQVEDSTINLNPSKVHYQIPKGYHSGNSIVFVDYDQLLVTPSKDRQFLGNVNGSFISAVTVEPIPDEYIIPSGTKKIEDNGTHDVTGYASVNVDVPPPDGYVEVSGTLDITANGTYVVEQYASVNVNVESSGGDDLADFLADNLTSLSSNATYIKAHSFRGSLKIISVDMPEATSIGGYAFYGAKNLAEVNFPKLQSVSSDGQIFYQCAMESVVFPSLTSTGSTYFLRDCSDLLFADLPKVTSISSSAFNGCRSLTTLILRSQTMVTLANTNAFTNCYRILGTKNTGYNPTGEKCGWIYVPSALKDQYAQATNWSTFASQFRAIEDYPEITGG